MLTNQRQFVCHCDDAAPYAPDNTPTCFQLHT